MYSLSANRHQTCFFQASTGSAAAAHRLHIQSQTQSRRVWVARGCRSRTSAPRRICDGHCKTSASAGGTAGGGVLCPSSRHRASRNMTSRCVHQHLPSRNRQQRAGCGRRPGGAGLEGGAAGGSQGGAAAPPLEEAARGCSARCISGLRASSSPGDQLNSGGSALPAQRGRWAGYGSPQETRCSPGNVGYIAAAPSQLEAGPVRTHPSRDVGVSCSRHCSPPRY